MSTTLTQPRPHLRWAHTRDLAACAAICEACPLLSRWTADALLEALRERDVFGYVAEDVRAGEVRGFMLYRLCEDHLQLLALAVDPACRMAGVGGALVARLQNKVRQHRRFFVSALVPETEAGALRFFGACGLRPAGIVRGWFGEGCDGVEVVWAA